jgi:hypothetical protein
LQRDQLKAEEGRGWLSSCREFLFVHCHVCKRVEVKLTEEKEGDVTLEIRKLIISISKEFEMEKTI